MDERSSAEKTLAKNPRFGKSIEATEMISRCCVEAKLNPSVEGS
jgi:hypothetical protein